MTTLRPALLLILLGFLLATLAACSTESGEEEVGATLPLTDCQLGGVEALCGSLQVAENRAIAGGRTLDIPVAVIPAQSSVKATDPLFLLAGGPGQAATEAFPPLLSLFDDLNDERDIVLVDQRGTGESSPLKCAALEEENAEAEISEEAALALLQECAAELRDKVDLAQYTTDAAAADLDAVREGLGYEQVNLLGISYGTRVAQAYARLFPERVRTIVLDAVTGPELVLFLQMPRDGQRALELLFERCAADASCDQNFPNFRDEYAALLETLAAEPLDVALMHPLSGELIDMTLTRDMLTNLVYATLYSPELTALLPLLVHEAHENGRFESLVAQGLMAGQGAGLNMMLLYAVTCAEDAPLIDLEEAALLQEKTQFALRADDFLEICGSLPEAQVAADFRAPLEFGAPVLLLSGAADPVTPPVYAEQVAAHLPNSLHIVLPGYAHGLTTVGCTPKVIARFIEAGSLENLDTACLDALAPPAFFVDHTGPDP